MTLDPEKEIAVLGGSKIGLVELPLALMNPGETILLPDPGYPDYLSGVTLARVKLALMTLTAENTWLPDYTKIKPEVAAAAKLLYLNYPNNPTTAVATPEFYDETIAFAKAHQIGIVSDFAYGALGFDGQRPVSSCSSLVPKMSALSYTRCPRHTIWRDGGWPLLLAMLT